VGDGSQDIYDPAFVKGVFDRCSSSYIALSFLFSFGFTERWRRQCVGAMPELNDEHASGYDLMAGTGEVWPHLLRRHPALSSIVAVDISSGMHALAMERLHSLRAHKIDFVEDNVLVSKLLPGSADFVVSTFGLKTFDDHQQQDLARLVGRVLKPGGVFSFIEASEPKGWWLRPLYMFYLRTMLPLVERTLLKGAQDFAMIGAYTSNFGDVSRFAGYLKTEGLDVQVTRYFFGCASGVAGRKLSVSPVSTMIS
jgi:ubiquinone/menaquinone biosynthesis C-methylase UbiE